MTQPVTAQEEYDAAARHYSAGNLKGARKALTRGLALSPNDTALLRLLVDVNEHAHDLNGALSACAKLAQLSPADGLVRVKAGRLWMRLFDHARAVTEFNAALTIDPLNALAMEGLADVWRMEGRVEGARAMLVRRAEAGADPQVRAASRFKARLTSPVVARDAAEIGTARGVYEAALAAGPEISLDDPWRLGLGPNFYLGYQGRDDRALQTSLAAYYLRATPSLAVASKFIGEKHNGGNIRVGIVSNFFSKHTVGYLSYGLVAHLDRSRFELVLFRTPEAAQDGHTARFLAAAPCVDLPADIPAARARIAETRPDILYYPEIGMDHFAYFLAFARLAPLQCVGWGHPITTGIPNMDLFMSVDAMEPAGGASHYSERLMKLGRLSFCAERPAPPENTFAFPQPGPAYVCAQSIYKVHPDFDATLAQLLRADRDGHLYFVTFGAHADSLLHDRLARSLGADIARVHILPRMTRLQFLAFLRAADVLLDVPQWSGGKTSLEAIAMGTPIVHSPGEFMRGRHTLAFYRYMGVSAAIAGSQAAYINTATRLVHDRAFRADVRGQIAAHAGSLFDDAASIREIEELWTMELRARQP